MAWNFPLTYRRILRLGDSLYVSGWTHELTVGTLGSEVGFRSNNYGTLDPQNIGGTGVNDLRDANSGGIIELTFDGLAQPRPGGTYIITFPEGHGPYSLTWNGFSNDYRYNVGSTELSDYLLSREGQTLGIKIE